MFGAARLTLSGRGSLITFCIGPKLSTLKFGSFLTGMNGVDFFVERRTGKVFEVPPVRHAKVLSFVSPGAVIMIQQFRYQYQFYQCFHIAASLYELSRWQEAC